MIDVYQNSSADLCDEVLVLRPGTDTALILALMNELDQNHLIDYDFVNEYTTGFDSSTPRPLPMDGNRLADARWIVFSGTTNGVERLELYRRPVSNRDVLAHYRERMPVDLVIGNSVVPAGAPTPVAVLVAPGGTYMKPNPVEPAEPAPATVDLELRIERIVREYRDKNQPWRVTRSSFEPCGEATRRTALVVDRPMEVATEPATLEPGDYRIVCTLARRGPGALWKS